MLIYSSDVLSAVTEEARVPVIGCNQIDQRHCNDLSTSCILVFHHPRWKLRTRQRRQ